MVQKDSLPGESSTATKAAVRQIWALWHGALKGKHKKFAFKAALLRANPERRKSRIVKNPSGKMMAIVSKVDDIQEHVQERSMKMVVNMVEKISAISPDVAGNEAEFVQLLIDIENLCQSIDRKKEMISPMQVTILLASLGGLSTPNGVNISGLHRFIQAVTSVAIACLPFYILYFTLHGLYFLLQKHTRYINLLQLLNRLPEDVPAPTSKYLEEDFDTFFQLNEMGLLDVEPNEECGNYPKSGENTPKNIVRPFSVDANDL